MLDGRRLDGGASIRVERDRVLIDRPACIQRHVRSDRLGEIVLRAATLRGIPAGERVTRAGWSGRLSHRLAILDLGSGDRRATIRIKGDVIRALRNSDHSGRLQRGSRDRTRKRNGTGLLRSPVVSIPSDRYYLHTAVSVSHIDRGRQRRLLPFGHGHFHLIR